MFPTTKTQVLQCAGGWRTRVSIPISGNRRPSKATPDGEGKASKVRAELTRNQQLVLERLEKSQGPLSAYALLDELREQGFRAPLQVYRALDRLMKAGLVHRLESLNSFVACTDSHSHEDGMTAFAICENCGSVAEFADPVVGERLESWIGESGFRPAKAVIEFRGLCRDCAAA